MVLNVVRQGHPSPDISDWYFRVSCGCVHEVTSRYPFDSAEKAFDGAVDFAKSVGGDVEVRINNGRGYPHEGIDSRIVWVRNGSIV